MKDTITECCPYCNVEVTLEWDIEANGHKAFCPYCGQRLMLCSECEPVYGCDYNHNTDSCKWNRNNFVPVKSTNSAGSVFKSRWLDVK